MGIGALDAALTGLRVSQQQINVISTNVANATNPGFTRKTQEQIAQSIEGETVGVAGGQIVRKVDLNLSRDLWTQVSAVQFYDVQQAYLGRIEQFHGPPDAELSVAAEISALRDAFSGLSDNPGDVFQQANVVNQAIDTAGKINDLAGLINTLRNDVQDDMIQVIDQINALLVQVADFNQQIQTNLNLGRTTAAIEDQRDNAIIDLSQLIEISSFTRGDGVLVVQTNQGVQLADQAAEKLAFNPTSAGPTTFYPDSLSGVYVVNQAFTGDPTTEPSAIEITASSPNGKLGGLIDLRDDKFPRQTAQLDELAHKLALRMDAQGLTLFTDRTGSIPSDNPPDLTTTPETAVDYVGFASEIQVNTAILSDNSLLQSGTFGGTVQSGSNEVIRRVIDYTFGNVDFQQALNTDFTNTGVDLLNTGGDDLQTWLGLSSENSVLGNRDLSAFADVNALIASANGALDPPTDQFNIVFSEARTVPALGPMTITVDLAAAQLQAGANATQQIAAEIDAQIAVAVGGTPAFAGLNADALVGPNGELQINSSGTIEIDATAPVPVDAMGQTGLDFLGLTEATTAPSDPYFDIAVGNNTLTRITLEPGDTVAQLLTKLQAVPDLAIDTDALAIVGVTDGILRLRPGNDYNNPDFGGDIRIIGGPFETDATATYAATGIGGGSTRAGIDAGVNVASALFGTYSAGPPVVDFSPVNDVTYGSQISTGNTSEFAFRQDFLGPGATISTNILGSTDLIGYSQKMVNEQTQDIINIQRQISDEKTLRDLLQTQLQNESGVNLDEELGNLIIYQTSFNAAARVINAVDELFQELLNAIR